MRGQAERSNKSRERKRKRRKSRRTEAREQGEEEKPSDILRDRTFLESLSTDV